MRVLFFITLISLSVEANTGKFFNINNIKQGQYYNIKTLELIDMSKFDPGIPYEHVYSGTEILNINKSNKRRGSKPPTHWSTGVPLKKDTSRTCYCDDPESEIPKNAFLFSVMNDNRNGIVTRESDPRYGVRWELPNENDDSLQYHCITFGMRNIPVPAKYKVIRISKNSRKCGCEFYKRELHGKFKCVKWYDRYILERKDSKCKTHVTASPSWITSGISRLPQCIDYN